MSSNTNQVYNNLTIPNIQKRSNYNYTTTSKYGYIYTSAFTIIQLNNGMSIRKNI